MKIIIGFLVLAILVTLISDIFASFQYGVRKRRAHNYHINNYLFDYEKPVSPCDVIFKIHEDNDLNTNFTSNLDDIYIPEELDAHDRMFGKAKRDSSEDDKDPQYINIFKSNGGHSYFGAFQEISSSNDDNENFHQQDRSHQQKENGMDTYLPNDENDELNDNNMRFTDDYLKRNKAKVIKQHKTAIVSSTKKHKKNGVRRKFKNNDNNNINENYYNDKKKRSVNRMRSENLENIMLDFQGDSKDNEDNSLENAKLAQAIIHSILKDSVPGMKKQLGICQKRMPENFIDFDTENEEHKIVSDILRSVESALQESLTCKECLTLHVDLAEFLNWLLYSNTQSCCTQLERIQHDRNYYQFHPSAHLCGFQCDHPLGPLADDSGILKPNIPGVPDVPTSKIPDTLRASSNHSNNKRVEDIPHVNEKEHSKKNLKEGSKKYPLPVGIKNYNGQLLKLPLALVKQLHHRNYNNEAIFNKDQS